MANKKKAPQPATDDARASAWTKVQKLLDQANNAVVAWQEKFASRGPRIAETHEIPNTPAHRRAQAKRQRHADAVAAGEMNYKDIALERQAEFADHVAKLSAADRATLNAWAARQAATHGAPIGVWEHHAMPWPLVFLAARYGAEVEHWPASLTADDKARLASLEKPGASRLPLVEPLHVAVANKQDKRRVHLFAADAHASHVAAAVAATTSPSSTKE